MHNFLRTAFLAGFLLAPMMAYSNDAVDPPSIKNTQDIIESGYATPGSPVHSWLRGKAPGVSDYEGFTYHFHLINKDGSPVSIVELLIEGRKADKNIIFSEQPSPPTNTPNGIPSTGVTNDSCAQFLIGSQSAVGNLTVTWTYRYTRDTNNDGKNDANPKWQISGFSITNMQFLTEGQPISC